MAKLQKQLSRKVGDKEYDKWVLIIPPKTIKEVGFKEGQDLKIIIKKNQLVIES